MLQQGMEPDDGASPQKSAVSPRAEYAWMVNAETQTYDSSHPPLWADDQFSFLELQVQERDAKKLQGEESAESHSKQRTESKVHILFMLTMHTTCTFLQ